MRASSRALSKSMQSKKMCSRVRSPLPHSQITSRGSKSRLNRRVYSAVKECPTAKRSAVQKEEREGGRSALSTTAHSGWFRPSGGDVSESWYARDVRGFLCHSLAHCS